MRKAKLHRSLRPNTRLGLGATIMAAAMLAGCQTAQYPEIQQTGSLRAFRTTDRHPIIVEPGQAQLQVDVPGYSRGLTRSQAGQVREFLADYRSLGEAEFVVAAPSGTANEESAMAAVNDIRNLVNSAGIARGAVRYVAYRDENGQAEPPILLSFGRFFAKAAECGFWPRNLAHEPYNKPYANFGCASQNNLAAIVADPLDLVRSRAMAEGDAARRYEVFEQYRRGRVTSADRSAEETANVAEVE